MSMGRKDTHLERVVICQYPLIGKRGPLAQPHHVSAHGALELDADRAFSRIDFSRGPSQLYDEGGSF